MAKRAVLLSIKPCFADLIFNGTKTVELRRHAPKIKSGDLVFLYVASPIKAVRGAFSVEEVVSGTPRSVWRRFGDLTGITKQEFDAYFVGKQTACAIVVRDAWEMKGSISLKKLRGNNKNFRPPQSFRYQCPKEFQKSHGFSLPKRLAA